MRCKKTSCDGTLEVARSCRRIRMRCTRCGHEYRIHEVADQLDRQTEEKLAAHTTIIYD